MSKRALQHYQDLNHEGVITEATPYKLIQMLMQGALDKLHSAKGHMQKNQVAIKGTHISAALSILDCLQVSLDQNQGGEVAANLNDLYRYMMDRLVFANLHNDTQALNEVITLLQEIKSGWDGIEPNKIANP